MRLIIAAVAGVALAVATAGAAAADGCHAVFVAGEGVVDSCTGKHRSPYPDPPPEPEITVIEVNVSPVINVTNTNVSSSSSSAYSNASAGAAAQINRTRQIITYIRRH